MDFNLFSQNSGYLHLILGPMFSGKTTELIRIYNKYTACGIKCLMINHGYDTRYSNEGHVTSHSQEQIKSLNLIKLERLDGVFGYYDVFLINEGQFFPDLYEVVKMLVDNQKKHVFVCGLDGDFKREKFGQMLDLIPLCDNVVKLKAVCQNCYPKKANGYLKDTFGEVRDPQFPDLKKLYASIFGHRYNLVYEKYKMKLIE